MTNHLIKIDKQSCIGCGKCAADCVSRNISISDKKASINSDGCIKCGHCAAICPQNAVTISGYEQPPFAISQNDKIDPALLLGALRARRSIRQFTKEAVSEKDIEQIIEAGRWTPTAKNAQDISYAILKNQISVAESHAVKLFKKLMPFVAVVRPSLGKMKIDDSFFFKGAPLAIVIISADKISGALAASNMALMAEACGLGVLYSGFFSMAANHSKVLRQMLGIFGKRKAVTTLVIGHANVEYRRTVQKEKAEAKYL